MALTARILHVNLRGAVLHRLQSGVLLKLQRELTFAHGGDNPPGVGFHHG